MVSNWSLQGLGSGVEDGCASSMKSTSLGFSGSPSSREGAVDLVQPAGWHGGALLKSLELVLDVRQAILMCTALARPGSSRSFIEGRSPKSVQTCCSSSISSPEDGVHRAELSPAVSPLHLVASSVNIRRHPPQVLQVQQRTVIVVANTKGQDAPADCRSARMRPSSTGPGSLTRGPAGRPARRSGSTVSTGGACGS